MAVMLDNVKPVDELDIGHHGWLSKLQGNILRGHGRPHSRLLFLRLGPDAAALVRVLAARFVTTALEQFQTTTSGDRRRLFGTLCVSASGYEAIGQHDLSTFREDPLTADDPPTTFAAGMRAASGAELGDPAPSTWDEPYNDRTDAVLLLAHCDQATLASAVAEATELVGRHGGAVAGTEVGRVIRNAGNQAVEHFGYVDGRSQPLYLKRDFKHYVSEPTREDAFDYPFKQWRPFEPLRRVLLVDPLGPDDECLGSYLVFRKLEQDVRGFVMREASLASELGLQGADRERAGAMAVGRFRDGTPLTVSPRPGWYPSIDNDFTYTQDPDGRRCPLHAHIRRVNPRGDTPGRLRSVDDRERRITRRGVTYGTDRLLVQPSVDPATLPSGGVGLLFMCYQASIRRQFAFLQNQWLNHPSFPINFAGVDPMVGQGPHVATPHRWQSVHNAPPSHASTFGQFVHMRGGEFFFAPSLPFLLGL